MNEPDFDDVAPDEDEGSFLDETGNGCGSCVFWRPTQKDDRDRWIGPCRVMPDRGEIPFTSAPCDRLTRRGTPLPEAPPPDRTRRRSRLVSSTGPVVRRSARTEGQRHQARHDPASTHTKTGTLFDPQREVLEMTQQELMDVLQDFFGAGPISPLGRRWEGGTLLLKPGEPGLQEKEVPVEVFFKKLVRVRDQLRLLEQKLNGHQSLTGSEKLELQAYLTRCYGSLTTFNVLFANAEDRFVGEKSSS